MKKKISSAESRARGRLSYYVWKTTSQAESNHETLRSLCILEEAEKQKRDGEYIYRRLRK